MPARRIALIVGSLRRDAFSLRTANALKLLQPPTLNLERVEIGGLALYNPDLEGETPFPWIEFRDAIRASDAVLFVTPEYNRSIPGALKNAIDVGSRPYGKSAWEGKPAGIISTSPGAIGGFGANHVLRQCCVFLDMPMMQQPEAYIGGVDKLIDAEGKVLNDKTKAFLEKYLHSFARWIEANMRAA
jgi:chromate reductase